MSDPTEPMSEMPRRPSAVSEMRQGKKRQKTTLLTDPSLWPRCKFWVAKKSRFCNLEKAPGCDYCGVHRAEVGGEGGQPQKAGDKRVPCPYDQGHTIYERDLESEPGGRDATWKDQTAKDVQDRLELSAVLAIAREAQDNRKRAGPSSEVESAQAEAGSPTEAENKDVEARIEAAGLAGQLRQEIARSGVDLKQFAATVHAAYEKHVGSLEEQSYRPPAFETAFKELADAWAESGASSSTKKSSAERHLKQQAAIVGNIEASGILDPDVTYVAVPPARRDLVAGLTAVYRNRVVPAAPLLLVERSTCRNKADKQLRALESAGRFRRLRVDIAHVLLARVPGLEDCPLVVTGKHLCGGATDLALRAATHESVAGGGGHGGVGSAGDGGDCAGPKHKRASGVCGIVIATCCHHRCDEESYVNLGWIEEVLGLQPSSRAGVAGAAGAAGAVPGPTFRLLRLVTSWGCSGGAPRRGREGGAIATSEGRVGAVTEDAPSAVGSDELGLSAEERAQLGREAKRLLDHGRVLWLRERSKLNAKLVTFCDASVSPENCLLLAS